MFPLISLFRSFGDRTAKERLLRVFFTLFLLGIAISGSEVLVYDRRSSALLVGAVAFFAIVWLETWSAKTLRLREFASRYLIKLRDSKWLMAAVVLVVLLPTFGVWFMGDDYGCLVAFHRLSLGGFFQTFHTDLATIVEGETGQEIRPLYSIYYFVNYKLWGLNPFGYHLLGISGHIVNSLLVFRLAQRIAPATFPRATAAGLLFAFQPAGSEAVSWICGAPAEIFPALFYVAAFLLFVEYRISGSRRYLAASVAAFLACLCSKEIAVTLPLMLVSYDLFWRPARTKDNSEIGPSDRSSISRLAPALLPFALLLVLYLGWRHTVFSHTLAENYWAGMLGSSPKQIGRSLIGQWVHAIRALLLPYPSVVCGIVLGLYSAWAFWLWSRRSEAKSIRFVLYFGAVWFSITFLPVLVAAPDARHLYLPSVGPCLALAFCAFPTQPDAEKVVVPRVAGFAFLIVISALMLAKENTVFQLMASQSEQEKKQLAAAVTESAPTALLVIKYPNEEVLPFPLEPPFAPAALLQDHRLIAPPGAFGWTLTEWRQNTSAVLHSALTETPGPNLYVSLVSWDERSGCYRSITQVLPKASLLSLTARVIGKPSDLSDVTEDQGDALVRQIENAVLAKMARGSVVSSPSVSNK